MPSQISIAVIGAGRWGPHLCRNFFENPRSRLAWVVESDRERLNALGDRFGSAGLSSDAADAYDDPEVEAVAIATPTSTHFELAWKALSAGKHVLVEKPLAASSEEAHRLCHTADEGGLVLMVGHVFLFNPAIRAAKEYIIGGQLGKTHYISMRRTNLGPVRTDVNAAWDLATHDLAIANYWLDSRPQTVSAVGGSWINSGIQDAVFLTLVYPGERIVHIEASWLHPQKARQITVVGEKQMLTVDDINLAEPLRIYDKGVTQEPSAGVVDTFAGFRGQIRQGAITTPSVEAGEPLWEECEAFVDRVEGRQGRVSDGWDGLAVVQALEAADRSMKDGGRETRVAGA